MAKIGLLVYDYSLHGGAEKVAINMANEFSKDNSVYFITCFNTKGKPIANIDNSVKIFILSKKERSLTIYMSLFTKKLRKYIYENEIDILINITAGVNTIGVLSTLGLNTKCIYSEHSNLLNKTYGFKHQIRQFIGAKYSDYVISLTEQDKDEFIKKYKIKNKCEYIYNWYEDYECNSIYDNKSKKILSVGRLESVKGYDRLIEVAKSIFLTHPDWEWHIYGGGSLEKYIREEIINNNLSENLFLKGNVCNIKEQYCKYSFFVMTSYYEGLPLVLLEAKQSNLPIVAFDCPTGPREIIQNEIDGYLIEDGDLESLTKKINYLIENSEIRQLFSKNSRVILGKFSKKTILGKWNFVFRNLLRR